MKKLMHYKKNEKKKEKGRKEGEKEGIKGGKKISQGREGKVERKGKENSYINIGDYMYM